MNDVLLLEVPDIYSERAKMSHRDSSCSRTRAVWHRDSHDATLHTMPMNEQLIACAIQHAPPRP